MAGWHMAQGEGAREQRSWASFSDEHNRIIEVCSSGLSAPKEPHVGKHIAVKPLPLVMGMLSKQLACDIAVQPSGGVGSRLRTLPAPHIN